MDKKFMRQPINISGFFLVMVLLLTSGCSLIFPASGAFSQSIEITLTEDLFTHAHPTFKVENRNFWEDLGCIVKDMELHDGFIRFQGYQAGLMGSGTACSIDLALSAENGLLSARVIALDVAGIGMQDSKVISVNQLLKMTLQLNDLETNLGVSFEKVDVSEDALNLKVKVTFGS
jgi:hypothetical protein